MVSCSSRTSWQRALPLILAAAVTATGCEEAVDDGLLGQGGTSGGGSAAPPEGTAPSSGNQGNGSSGSTGVASGGSMDWSGSGGLGTDDGGALASGGMPKGEAYGDWTYVEVEGALCRDGSPAGYYYRMGSDPNLHIYLNGGGACADSFFCSLNPANVEEDLPHERLINAAGNVLIGPDPVRQMPPKAGIFTRKPENPVRDWSAVYIPYCTGDVHGGVRRDVEVPGAPAEGKNQFVGYTNVGLFLDSFGPSFADASKVLLTGSSAGAFGVLLNFDRVQEYFNQYDSQVFGISDSGVPMRDSVDGVDYMAPCLQKRWRDLWGLNEWLPKDCRDCFRSDGGGLVESLGKYLFQEKYAGRMAGGFISSTDDNVMRGFFGAGGNPNDPASHCDNTDPGANVILEATIGGVYNGATYHAGIRDSVYNVVGEDRIGYFIMPGDKHVHLWRDRFYANEAPIWGGGTDLTMTIAEWVGDLLEGKPTHVGTL